MFKPPRAPGAGLWQRNQVGLRVHRTYLCHWSSNLHSKLWLPPPRDSLHLNFYLNCQYISLKEAGKKDYIEKHQQKPSPTARASNFLSELTRALFQCTSFYFKNKKAILKDYETKKKKKKHKRLISAQVYLHKGRSAQLGFYCSRSLPPHSRLRFACFKITLQHETSHSWNHSFVERIYIEYCQII